ncbi:helix-hairpin-helix domain-containing protein [Sporohalobacter salinus]|uniref:helix-hairpin-helix domain-containing protein n=1 Tax=Sporohalobacter salinus TaxID=1494606 RepID=UPI001960F350|nr:helix-hairpin-helix domain-containing protein [Sporohalobacter salinus]MBM7623123.1 competence protein ComEA [Sporohalobacter salinus]
MFRFTKREEVILLVVIITLVIGSGIITVKYFTGKDTEEVFVADSLEKETVKSKTETSKEEQKFANNKSDKILVQVGGEVNQPGVYKLREGSRVFRLLDKAKGTTSKANLDQMNLVKKLKDGEKIIVPKKNIIEEKSDKIKVNNEERTDENKINLNTASKKELKELYRVGSVLAERIIEYRNRHGGFKDITELKKVSRIGEKTFQNNKERLTVQ